MTTKTSPDATSSDYDAMLPYWEMVRPSSTALTP